MQHKRWRPAILVLALALATGGEYLLMLDSKVGGWALLAAALPLLIYALGRPSRQAPDAARASLWNPARLSLILLAVTGNLVALHLLWRDNTDSLGFILWLISLAGIILATPARPRTVRPVAHRFEIILLAIILLLALFLRLFDIQNLPPGIFIDETNAAIDALKIMDGEKSHPLAPAGSRRPCSMPIIWHRSFAWWV